MPPKKSDKGKKDAKPDASTDEQEEERELVEKELVIGYLRSKLGRYQDHGEKLQIENIKLNDDLELQKLNLRDINEFLTNELKARSLTTSALEAKVSELGSVMEEHRKTNEESLKKLRSDKDREITRLEGLLAEHERRARVTQEYLEHKEQLEAELHVLRETLIKQTKDFEQKMTDIDRQHIQDRERWKREKAQKVKETKLAMMKLTDNQLEMTTKRTIMENEQMSVELSYQSRQTEKLLAKNTKVLQENADLRRQLELGKQTEEELAKRNNLYQKTIKTLLGKLKDQGQQATDVNADLTALEERVTDLQAANHLLELQLGEKDLEVDRLREALARKGRDSDQHSGHRQDAAQFLLACLADVKEKILTTVIRHDRQQQPLQSTTMSLGGGGFGGSTSLVSGFDSTVGLTGDVETDITIMPGKLEDLSLEQRERVLAYLLEKLKTFLTSRLTDGSADFALAAAVSAQLGVASEPSGVSGMSSGLGGAGGSAVGVTLPPIPSFNRRQYVSHSPLASMGDFAGDKNAMPTSSAGAVNSSRGSGIGFAPMTSGEMGPMVNDRGLLGSAVTGSSGQPDFTTAPSQQQEATDELISKIMSDVRPWGKKVVDSSPLSKAMGAGRRAVVR